MLTFWTDPKWPLVTELLGRGPVGGWPGSTRPLPRKPPPHNRPYATACEEFAQSPRRSGKSGDEQPHYIPSRGAAGGGDEYSDCCTAACPMDMWTIPRRGTAALPPLCPPAPTKRTGQRQGKAGKCSLRPHTHRANRKAGFE